MTYPRLMPALCPHAPAPTSSVAARGWPMAGPMPLRWPRAPPKETWAMEAIQRKLGKPFEIIQAPQVMHPKAYDMGAVG